MADIVSPEVRSRMMAGIRGKNTRPELQIRRGLHASGFRYRLHARDIPGKPDLVFPKYRAVVFVHGCFWHGHACELFRMPSTRTEFWSRKISANRLRDTVVSDAIQQLGWRKAVIWECALKGKARVGSDVVVQRLAKWLQSSKKEIEIGGADVL